MKERREGPPQLTPQEELKRKLFSNEVDVKQFIDTLDELDQRTPTREDAEANAKLLEDPRVQEKLRENEEDKDDVENLISLTLFHKAQRAIASGKDGALSDFESALEAANRIENSEYNQWKLYLEATVAYFKKDIETLERIIPELEEGGNKNIVQRMLLGLKTNGEVNYRRDYNQNPSGE